jgi:hypothetical protein
MHTTCIMQHRLTPVHVHLHRISFHVIQETEAQSTRVMLQEGQDRPFVTLGGDGDKGEFSEWSEPSDCSRTCGGGVTEQRRTCLSPRSVTYRAVRASDIARITTC